YSRNTTKPPLLCLLPSRGGLLVYDSWSQDSDPTSRQCGGNDFIPVPYLSCRVGVQCGWDCVVSGEADLAYPSRDVA
ncbi:hypothetical protein GBAR_LOCUS9449, partial [Geodia barretti]